MRADDKEAVKSGRKAHDGREAPTQVGKFCTFGLGGIVIGIDVRKVQEVLRHDRMTPVPLGAPELMGLLNLRGEIVPALDLRRQLGLPVSKELVASVVVRAGEEPVALLVEEVGDVVEPSPLDFEPVPASVPGRVRDFVSGTYKLEGMLLLVLALDRLAAHFDQAAGQPRLMLQAAG
jgi:purine-binding chemotaxis protein CheW